MKLKTTEVCLPSPRSTYQSSIMTTARSIHQATLFVLCVLLLWYSSGAAALTVIIIGAGPAGLCTALALCGFIHAERLLLVLVERMDRAFIGRVYFQVQGRVIGKTSPIILWKFIGRSNQTSPSCSSRLDPATRSRN